MLEDCRRHLYSWYYIDSLKLYRIHCLWFLGGSELPKGGVGLRTAEPALFMLHCVFFFKVSLVSLFMDFETQRGRQCFGG
jgi:hypothetical protein